MNLESIIERDDFDCIDLTQFNPNTGEYAVRYWSRGILDGKIHGSFPEYMNCQIGFWESESSTRQAKSTVTKAYPEIMGASPRAYAYNKMEKNLGRALLEGTRLLVTESAVSSLRTGTDRARQPARLI